MDVEKEDMAEVEVTEADAEEQLEMENPQLRPLIGKS